ncbi:unnamed protein product [Owenia fusiformis]|uniref:Medium-chain acyl-CoA ligase ACSF2, mitochondrial n=1 Tax=Owenia fusiformis TaxID=6347 RepID=A0A8J1TT46_OWEFU|nr:unnamed protein product [Owenia fusiformis]
MLTTSFCEGPTDKLLLDLTMGGALDYAVTHFPERTAFIYPFEIAALTYKQLHTKVCHVAAALLSRGLRPGDQVVLWTDVHCMELEVFSHAVTYAGLILVGVFLIDIEDVLLNFSCKAIIFPNFTWEYTNRESRLGRILGTTAASITDHETNTDSTASIAILPNKTSGKGTFLSFKTLLDEGVTQQSHLSKVKKTIRADDVAVIMLTSGTTGKPKGVTSTHSSMVNNGYFIGDRLHYSSKEHRICSLMQRYDDIGLVEAMCAFMHGATIVNPERNYDVEDITSVMQVIQNERCTAVHGFPSHFVNIISDPAFTMYDFKAVHTGFTCAAPMFSRKMLEILTKFTPDLVPGFGTTETKRNIQGFVTDSRIKRADTIGYPMPHTKVKIIDQESNIVPIGSAGELCLYSYSTMVKYWNQPEKTSKAIDDEGWYHTGLTLSLTPTPNPNPNTTPNPNYSLTLSQSLTPTPNPNPNTIPNPNYSLTLSQSLTPNHNPNTTPNPNYSLTLSQSLTLTPYSNLNITPNPNYSLTLSQSLTLAPNPNPNTTPNPNYSLTLSQSLTLTPTLPLALSIA